MYVCHWLKNNVSNRIKYIMLELQRRWSNFPIVLPINPNPGGLTRASCRMHFFSVGRDLKREKQWEDLILSYEWQFIDRAFHPLL